MRAGRTGSPGPTSAQGTRSWGSEKPLPDAVLAHCSLAHAGAWDGVASRLAEGGRRIVAPDLPGHGARPMPPPGCDVQAEAAHLLEAVAGKGPVDLVGHSFGATACLRLALSRPGLVRRLVLIEPVQFSLLRDAAPALWARHLDDARAMRRLLEAGDAEAATRAFYEKWGGGVPWPALPPAQRRYMVERIHLVAAAEAALMDDVGGIGAPGRLEGLEVPVLVLCGSESPPEIAAIAAVLGRRLPDCRVEAIRGAGHMAPITHPGPVAAAIEGFWRTAVRPRPQSRESGRSSRLPGTSR